MIVRDLMQIEVATLKVSDSLGLADDIMRLGRIRHLPVVADARVVGIISQRDLFLASISSALRLRHAAEREWLAGIHIREVMTRDVVTIHPQASIREAVQLMIEKRIGCLPVVEGDALVGLISEADCMQYLAHLLENAELKQVLPETLE